MGDSGSKNPNIEYVWKGVEGPQSYFLLHQYTIFSHIKFAPSSPKPIGRNCIAFNMKEIRIPMSPKTWQQGLVAVFIAMALGTLAINITTTPPLSNFQAGGSLQKITLIMAQIGVVFRVSLWLDLTRIPGPCTGLQTQCSGSGQHTAKTHCARLGPAHGLRPAMPDQSVAPDPAC